ncbi:aldehyde dehydrogenase [Microbacterium sp. NEAU-LLC]|uniref:Aldehyde dehydrogenase n=1 Tax=Microbacterium helvum TaxID=2773713 RepID=A0ABR8NQP7_9MICO|nr:aldehyde dehydrogenase family protein [Microbacterium helvum]MBD3942964.1 aldehyde dehydrogenase [Microbacterium helvum]
MTIIESTAPSAPAETSSLTETRRRELDAVIAELQQGEKAWARTSLAERAALLGRVHAAVADAAEEWAAVAGTIKGIDPHATAMGEEWISGPYPVLAGAGTLAHSLAALARRESPLARTPFGTAPGNRTTVKILPQDAHEWTLLNGFSAEVWMPPGVAASTVRSRAGLGSRRPSLTQGVGLVLGAGNITSIAPLDVLYQLIADNRVVLLKLNPVMADMEGPYRRALAPLIELGVLRIVQGGGDVGGYLAHHAGIAHVHITGSAATHDVVVYGPGDEGRRRKAARTPLLDKPITSELGGVAPVIVVPGRWTTRDLTYQAEHIATMRLHNGGYNCIAGQVVIVSEDWPQKEAFLAELSRAIDRAPARRPWYPGSDQRLAAAKAAYPSATTLGPDGGRLLVRATAAPDVIENTECFAPVLGVVEVPGSGQAFLDGAVAHANEKLVGTLGANILIAPRDRKALGEGFREAVAALRYGTIAVNAWTGVGFLTATAPWGAFPGHTLDDIQSGRGVVHNALLIEDPERTVVTGPFRPFPRSVAHGEMTLFPKPPWFVTARSAAATGRRLTEYATSPGWMRMPAVFAAAFRA